MNCIEKPIETMKENLSSAQSREEETKGKLTKGNIISSYLFDS